MVTEKKLNLCFKTPVLWSLHKCHDGTKSLAHIIQHNQAWFLATQTALFVCVCVHFILEMWRGSCWYAAAAWLQQRKDHRIPPRLNNVDLDFFFFKPNPRLYLAFSCPVFLEFDWKSPAICSTERLAGIFFVVSYLAATRLPAGLVLHCGLDYPRGKKKERCLSLQE